MTCFNCGAESVFKEFGEDVFEVSGHMGKGSVRLAIYDQRWADAVFQLTDLGDKGFAITNDLGGTEGSIDDADVAGVVLGLGRVSWSDVVGLGG